VVSSFLSDAKVDRDGGIFPFPCSLSFGVSLRHVGRVVCFDKAQDLSKALSEKNTKAQATVGFIDFNGNSLDEDSRMSL
jgi:hypothetical protein